MHLYTVQWTQSYLNWVPAEIEITDLSDANAVLERIMKL